MGLLREVLSVSLAHGWEKFGRSAGWLGVCLVFVGLVVLLQNGMARGLLRQRLNRGFDAFNCEWRGFAEALRRRRAREAARRLGRAISGWFRWQNLTVFGRAGNAVLAMLTLISVVLLLRALFFKFF